MARNSRVYQVDLIVDGDGPIAVVSRHTKGRDTRRYPCPIWVSKERKQQFIRRVATAQMALCRDIMEVEQNG